jgi:hypothetical protein
LIVTAFRNDDFETGIDILNIDIDLLREIGWTHWDPIGLLRPGQDWREASFKDEYDSYLRRVVKKVLAGESEGRIAAYLIGVACHAMCGGRSKRDIRAAVDTVRAVTALVEEVRGPRTTSDAA